MLTDAKRIQCRQRKAQERADNAAIHYKKVVKPMLELAALLDKNHLGSKPSEKARKSKKKKIAKIIHKSQPLCKKCGLPIAFKKVGEKWHPTNVDGSEHWELCSATKRKGKPFNPATDMQSSGVIIGKNFVQTNCNCLPWEGCEKCKQI